VEYRDHGLANTIQEIEGIMADASLKNGSVDLCVVGGAGHVGLPLALSFAAKGLRVLIYDVNEATLKTIAGGVLPFFEEGGQEMLDKALADQALEFTSDPGDIPPDGVLVVTIGTPVDEFLNPNHKVIEECFAGLLPHLTDGQLLVLRSTIYPGTTRWVDRYLKTAGKTLKVAFCPERVVQGKGIKELAELPQIVSGVTPEAAEKAEELFRLVAPEIVPMSPEEAEFAKLFDNCYRYIHFSISNQLYMITTAAGVDYHRVLAGMAYKYPRSQGIPSPGFAAGPCLFKDTMQLAAFARNQFTLGQEAMRVNEGLVLFIVEQLRTRYELENLTVGLLGMAFKADSDDIRASLSYKMKKSIGIYAREVLTTDPHVNDDPGLIPLEDVLERSDLLILCVPHTAYKGLEAGEKPVVDMWNFLEGANTVL